MDYNEIIRIIFLSLTGLFSLLLFHFIIFAFVGLFARKKFPKTEEKLKYGIIIPARNEEKVVGGLIESVYKNKYPQEKLHVFVIAHNCTDKTAEIARSMGATVYEYNNPQENTMGYAFRYLFNCIKKDYGIENYDGFFLFNADNILDENYFDKMNDAFVACGKKDVITSFRNSKNFGSNTISGMYGIYFITGCRLESRGRTVLGCSTRVQGTGYVINSNIVKDGWPYVTLTEDWEFSADQILQGNKIKYCDEAIFYDEQPTGMKVMLRQRLRWAKGHLLVCLTKTKQLVKRLFTRKHKANGKGCNNRFSTFDILVNILPICVIGSVILTIELLCLAISPLFTTNSLEICLLWLKTLGFIVGLTYVTNVVSAIIIFTLERKRIKNVKWWQKIVMCLVWPIFILISVPIEWVALFSKNVGWKPIPHNDTTNFDKLNEKNESNSKDKK